MVENAIGGIILTAQTFNPSIFTETWMARNNVVKPESLVGPRICSPEVAQFQTNDIQVMVVPPKMQILFPMQGVSDAFDLPRKIAVRTVELLPHTPYQALGFNFEYFVAQPAGQDFNAYDRALLGTGDCRLLREFSLSDARFGRYFSKNYEEGRLRLDIKPVKAGPENKEFLQFSFNFHFAVAQLEQPERVKQLLRLIEKWGSIQKYAETVVETGSSL